MKKRTVLMVRIIFSGSLILFFLFTLARKHGSIAGAFSQFYDIFSGLLLVWLLPALSLHLVGLTLISMRWKILLSAQGYRIPFGRLFSFYFMAAFFNNFLPSTIGGDAIRAIEINRELRDSSVSVLVVIIERLTGMLALLLISLTALFVKLMLGGDLDRLVLAFILIGLCFMALLIVLGIPKIAKKCFEPMRKVLPVKIADFLKKSFNAIGVYYHHPGAVAKALIFSVAFQLNMIFYYFFIALALRLEVQLLDFMLRIPVMIFLLMVIPAVNGLGVRTVSFERLMRFPGVSALTGDLVDIGMRVMIGLMGGGVYLFYRRSDKKDLEPGQTHSS